jgi:hypothetical protein
MNKFLRRLRGLIGSGLMWAGGFVVFMGIAWGFNAPLHVFMEELPFLASIGFLMGGAYGSILALAERNRRLEDLPLWRVGLWGALGSFVVIWGVSIVLGSFPGFAMWSAMTGLSGAFAAGQVALAKLGERQLGKGEDPFLLETTD